MANVDDIFLGTSWTTEQMYAARSDAMWPIMRAMFNTTRGQLRCGHYVPPNTQNLFNVIEVTDPFGFSAFRITKVKDEIIVSEYIERYGAKNYALKTLIRSKHVPYICAAITKKKGALGVKIEIEPDRVEAHIALKYLLVRLIIMNTRTQKEGWEYSTEINIPLHLFVEMADVVQGRKVSMSDTDVLNRTLHTASRRINNIRNNILNFNNLFGRDKWIVISRSFPVPDPREGVIVGAVNLEKIAKKHTGTRTTWSTTELTEIDITVPLKFYNRVGDIPVEIRQPLLVNMMMAKVSQPQYYPNVGDEFNRLLPTAEFFDADIGACALQLENSRTDEVWGQVYVMDR